jgi:hypothetical protein
MKPYKGRKHKGLLNAVVVLTFVVIVLLVIWRMDMSHEAEKAAWQARREIVTEYIPVPDVRVVRVVVTPEATIEPEAKPEATPSPRLELTDAEKDKIVRVVWHEARGESPEGQQAVIEVIFNRIEADNFPDTVDEVINQPGQFSCAPYLDIAEPGQAQYDALDAALYGDPILPKDVVYFSRAAENDRVWGVIGGHTFCYQYVW